MPIEQMLAPLVGPAHPYNKDGIAAGQKNHRSGQVEVSPADATLHGCCHQSRACLITAGLLSKPVRC